MNLLQVLQKGSRMFTVVPREGWGQLCPSHLCPFPSTQPCAWALQLPACSSDKLSSACCTAWVLLRLCIEMWLYQKPNSFRIWCLWTVNKLRTLVPPGRGMGSGVITFLHTEVCPFLFISEHFSLWCSYDALGLETPGIRIGSCHSQGSHYYTWIYYFC